MYKFYEAVLFVDIIIITNNRKLPEENVVLNFFIRTAFEILIWDHFIVNYIGRDKLLHTSYKFNGVKIVVVEIAAGEYLNT